MELTPQQQAVVAHDHGPALVYAVAGAGKTTAMVHRIERLVREKIVPPARILATSFGRSNAVDLTTALQQWPHCRAVDARTLHSLGLDIIKEAGRRQLLRGFKLGNDELIAPEAGQRLLNHTLARARRADLPFKRDLDGLDRQDFLDYVGRCKGNLQFADINTVRLPAAAQEVAAQAAPPSDALAWYLPLYQLFEEIRQEQGLITFDDMLLTGWQLLAQHPELLAAFRQRYDSIIVDEYQDINLAQWAILDLLSREHGNIMVVGDDDQTIYEWRGANLQFILDFADHYQAATYLIADNFRCPAAPLLLADKLIQHNQRRQAKHLSLTRGFGGETAVRHHRDLPQMANRILADIRRLHNEEAFSYDGIAVLVRFNAQTPLIEQALIRAGIPYRISQPFYERREIQTLIHYGRLAWLERRFQQGEPVSDAMRESAVDSWHRICNQPKRYISRELARGLADEFRRQDKSFSQILLNGAARAEKAWQTDNLARLAQDLLWLAERQERDAHRVLQGLEARLAYKAFLRDSAGSPQTGEGRALSVAAFITYARGQGNWLAFMQQIRQLQAQNIGAAADEPAVILSTIHRAKGLEWPVVIVPQCNQSILPGENPSPEEREEERRLFYVALTRPQQQLYLHVVRDEPASPFLAETAWERVLADCSDLGRLTARPLTQWLAADMQRFLQLSHRHRLQRYFAEWWATPAAREKLAARVVRFGTAVSAADPHNLLAIPRQELALWQQLAPAQETEETADFPGLDRLLQKKPRRRTGQAQSTSFSRRMTRALKGNGGDRLGELIGSLKDPSAAVRWVAAKKLAGSGSAETVRAVSEFLPGAPAYAVDDALTVLRHIAENPDEADRVRTAARRALKGFD